MARLAMRQDPVKDLEKILSQVVSDNLPQREAFEKISALLVSSCVDTFEEALKNYRTCFVEAIGSFSAAHDSANVLLPEGTRFFRQTDESAVFVIEHKPCVRNLIFKASAINAGRLYKPRFRLALPYLIFIPVFKFNPLRFSCMCVAYRTASLTSMDDMLYHPNLPNLGRPLPGGKDKPEGDVRSFAEMVMCQGYDLDLSGEDSLQGKIQQLMDHFWNSAYSAELTTMWDKMQDRCPQFFKDLNTWEEHSAADPTFVLRIPWVPAIRLNRLVHLIFEHHDTNSSRVGALTTEHISDIYTSSWQIVQGKIKEGQHAFAATFLQKLDEILKTFAANLAKGMMVITNDTIRRTVQLAIAKALKDAV